MVKNAYILLENKLEILIAKHTEDLNFVEDKFTKKSNELINQKNEFDKIKYNYENEITSIMLENMLIKLENEEKDKIIYNLKTTNNSFYAFSKVFLLLL